MGLHDNVNKTLDTVLKIAGVIGIIGGFSWFSLKKDDSKPVQAVVQPAVAQQQSEPVAEQKTATKASSSVKIAQQHANTTKPKSTVKTAPVVPNTTVVSATNTSANSTSVAPVVQSSVPNVQDTVVPKASQNLNNSNNSPPAQITEHDLTGDM